MVLPPWVAVMEQVPGVRVVTVAPETLQTAGVPDEKDTGRPEDADAVRVTGTPTGLAAGGVKVMVCACCPARIRNDCVTSGAAAYTVSPPWRAVMVQVPAARVMTAVPDAVHTAGLAERRDTGRPEDATAAGVTGTPARASGGGPKVMCCGCFPARTGKVRATSRAAL